MTKKVFILAPYPIGEAPSQRFRFEQYIDELSSEELSIEIHPFLNDKTWNKLYNKGSFFGKAFGISGSFFICRVAALQPCAGVTSSAERASSRIAYCWRK